jgi:hypothetical protein
MLLTTRDPKHVLTQPLCVSVLTQTTEVHARIGERKRQVLVGLDCEFVFDVLIIQASLKSCCPGYRLTAIERHGGFINPARQLFQRRGKAVAYHRIVQ